jgi:hypothetical protein
MTDRQDRHSEDRRSVSFLILAVNVSRTRTYRHVPGRYQAVLCIWAVQNRSRLLTCFSQSKGIIFTFSFLISVFTVHSSCSVIWVNSLKKEAIIKKFKKSYLCFEQNTRRLQYRDEFLLSLPVPVKKTELTTGGIRCADHATSSIRKSWH